MKTYLSVLGYTVASLLIWYLMPHHLPIDDYTITTSGLSILGIEFVLFGAVETVKAMIKRK